ncbi:hypothetical protein CDV31_013699 [Fusarium ambrosium]|uniref:Uncharacterized protein n=1 Tax=Fusarium ambrosium TaxID=131363 RepID=A0A428T1T7_9HYPO|nr:hypothetical protein CDV31_013699 [Fusarium ambrosium]
MTQRKSSHEDPLAGDASHGHWKAPQNAREKAQTSRALEIENSPRKWVRPQIHHLTAVPL